MMDANDRVFRIFALSGSLRTGSYTTAFLNALIEALPRDVAATTFDIACLPHYTEDLDTDSPPEPVRALKAAIAASDGILIVTPEYNHSVPGTLKNAIDWASRPGYASCLADKPVSFMTTSVSGLGGVRAQAHLHEIFLSTASRIVPGKQVVVGQVKSKLEAGRFVDTANLDFALLKVDELLREIALVKGWPQRAPIGAA